ncbi:hypothetical protein ACJX0J_023591, partial [Zea mays]
MHYNDLYRARVLKSIASQKTLNYNICPPVILFTYNKPLKAEGLTNVEGLMNIIVNINIYAHLIIAVIHMETCSSKTCTRIECYVYKVFIDISHYYFITEIHMRDRTNINFILKLWYTQIQIFNISFCWHFESGKTCCIFWLVAFYYLIY